MNKKEKEAYIQLIIGLAMCIGLALWVSFSDWKVKFPTPPTVSKTVVFGR